MPVSEPTISRGWPAQRSTGDRARSEAYEKAASKSINRASFNEQTRDAMQSRVKVRASRLANTQSDTTITRQKTYRRRRRSAAPFPAWERWPSRGPDATYNGQHKCSNDQLESAARCGVNHAEIDLPHRARQRTADCTATHAHARTRKATHRSVAEDDVNEDDGRRRVGGRLENELVARGEVDHRVSAALSRKEKQKSAPNQ